MMGLLYDDKVDAAVGTIFYLKGNIRITNNNAMYKLFEKT